MSQVGASRETRICFRVELHDKYELRLFDDGLAGR